jgi:16S rRNA A1518/A1519 N6-dimethyltransferase RsmA/KsgA/DIM1 with predicted DNA glycosylase/AP lyase activity
MTAKGSDMQADDPAFLLADEDLDQYFLVSPDKVALLIDAADIRPTDDVVELGAGIGTVASNIPECASLTVIELDARLAQVLRKRLQRAVIIQGDALSLVRDLRSM